MFALKHGMTAGGTERDDQAIEGIAHRPAVPAQQPAVCGGLGRELHAHGLEDLELPKFTPRKDEHAAGRYGEVTQTASRSSLALFPTTGRWRMTREGRWDSLDMQLGTFETFVSVDSIGLLLHDLTWINLGQPAGYRQGMTCGQREIGQEARCKRSGVKG